MKKPQFFLALTGIILVFFVYYFGQFKSTIKQAPVTQGPMMSGGEMPPPTITIDTLLTLAKSNLSSAQINKLAELEKKTKSASNKDAQLAAFHQLTHFWKDSARIFEPYAWYEGEAARLENSEKSLTFAARLFLDDLQNDGDQERRRWKALQAKDLFERSLTINPANDSAKVGLGACYLFGNISTSPMEGITKIREVTQKDSNNVYAQMMLIKGSLLSGQYEKGIERLNRIYQVDPKNIEAILLMAELYERTGDKKSAISWYEKSLSFAPNKEIKSAITQRIEELKK